MEASRSHSNRVRHQHRPEYRQVGLLLAQLRGEAGMTQRELAKRLKVSPGNIAKAEIGAKGIDVLEFCEWAQTCGSTAEAAIGRLRRSLSTGTDETPT